MMLPGLFDWHETTAGVTVRVGVSFLDDQSDPSRGRWFWAYHIRLENQRPQPVQLLTRHWRIVDGRGAVALVDGEGVVGEQPLIASGGSHDYVSGCPLGTPSGSMEGHYGMVDDGGLPFRVLIPRFSLIAPATAR